MALKDLMKRSLVHVFHIGQRLGVDILPRHFYSEIPVISRLKSTDHWRRPYSMIGVAGSDADEQLEFVKNVLSEPIRAHLVGHDVYGDACRENGAAGYGPVEAQFLFAFVARLQPRRIVQIGSGVSTALCLAAARFAGYQPQVTCIDPYPTDFLKDAANRGDIELIAKPVEVIGYNFFEHLGEGDLFFVDSTHTLGPAGEVTRIITEMLPRLPAGVFVHFHDIMFPYDYSPWILSEALFFWHESPLLHAFLCMNPGFRIRASLSQLHHAKQRELVERFAKYDPAPMKDGVATGNGDFPSSIYLEVAKERN